MIKYPFNIPGYGMIQDESALNLFIKHYEYINERMRMLINDNVRLYNQIPNNVVLWIQGGALQEVVAEYKHNIAVTLIDIDNLKVEQEDNINPIEIVLGDYPVNQLSLKTPKQYIDELLKGSFNYVIKDNYDE